MDPIRRWESPVAEPALRPSPGPMHRVSGRQAPPGPGIGRRGFTLIELLLVTVILGLLASITAPYFQRAREMAIVTQMKADARNVMTAVETYVAVKSSWPSSLAQLEEDGGYVASGEVQYCIFVAIPGSSFRDPYIIAMAGHPTTTKKVLILYPLWGSEMLEFDNGRRGC